MAKNHREPEKKLTFESSSDEEETSSDESESEPELTQEPSAKSASSSGAIKPLQPQPAIKPLQPQPFSDSNSESESDSDSNSESDSDEADQKVDPIPPKPAADPVTPATVKRPAEERPSDSKTSKKKLKNHAEPETSTKKQTVPETSTKKQTVPETSTKKQIVPETSTKKPLFQRIWSAEDEIVVLKGLTEYSTEKKSYPLADLSDFLDFIKKDIEFVNVSTLQLYSKLRRLKRKFINNHGKEKEGKLRTLSNLHEQKAYQLSKLFWGKAEGKNVVIASYPKMHFSGKLVGGDPDDRIHKMGDEMFGDGTEDAKEWNRMKIEENDAYIRHVEVKARQSMFVIEKLRSARK